MTEITVKHSTIIPRRTIGSDGKGSLFVIENGSFPFEINRVYVISGVTETGATRGYHAHHKTDQALFVLSGSLTMHLDDGESKQSLTLTAKDDGVRLGPLLWHSMSDFSANCIALVAASLPYDESDYIRDYESFKQYVRSV